MDSLAVSLESAFHAFNRTVNGPFHWAPDATRFYDDNATVLMASVILYLPVIFGLKVRLRRALSADSRCCTPSLFRGLDLASYSVCHSIKCQIP